LLNNKKAGIGYPMPALDRVTPRLLLADPKNCCYNADEDQGKNGLGICRTVSPFCFTVFAHGHALLFCFRVSRTQQLRPQPALAQDSKLFWQACLSL